MNLNPEQQLGVDSDARNTLVLAAAGSGKTRVVIEHYVRLDSENPLNANRSVIITYTVAAAQELRRRISERGVEPPLYIGTLHSFLLKLLRTHGRPMGISDSISVLDEETSTRILKGCIDLVGWKKPFSQAEKMIEQRHHTDVKGQALFDAYHRRLAKSNLISYDGILAHGLALLKTDHDITPFYCLMVDEYQDVSPLDHEIYLQVPAYRRFFVGDKRQAIFGFRGGSTKPIESLITTPEWTKIELLSNYRSTQLIIDAANNLMSAVGERPMKAETPEPGASYSIHCETPQKQLVQIESHIGSWMTEMDTRSIAVICRYNWHCEEVANYLRSAGLKVKQRRRQAEPQGWRAVRTLVAFYACPDNDELAYSTLVITQGEAVANLARQTATAQVSSINRAILKVEPVKLAEVLPMLVRANVSRECLDLVDKIQEELPLFSTTADLSAAIQSGYALDATEGEDDGITVCTIHASKGLEWDVVFVPYFNDEVLPGKNPDNLAEARRLAYVAITRARCGLYVFSTGQMKGFAAATTTEPSKPSRFIKEIWR